jgi:hypothetical protein
MCLCIVHHAFGFYYAYVRKMFKFLHSNVGISASYGVEHIYLTRLIVRTIYFAMFPCFLHDVHCKPHGAKASCDVSATVQCSHLLLCKQWMSSTMIWLAVLSTLASARTAEPMYTFYVPEAIFTNSSWTLFAKCSLTYSYLLARVGGGGGGGGGGTHNFCCPQPPYPAVHVTVHLYSSQTFFANCWWISPLRQYSPTKFMNCTNV